MKKRSLIFDSTLIYFLCMFGFLLLRILTQLLVRVFHIYINQVLDICLNIISQVGIMFLLPILLLSVFQKQKIKTTCKNFGYEKIQVLPILIAFLIGILCYFLNNSIASFFNNVITSAGYETLPSVTFATSSEPYTFSMFLINVVTTAILPAICEETTHRGLLLKGSYSLGIAGAVMLSSLLFGLIHLNINQFFYAAILGFIIGVVAVASKNIIPAMIIHFVNNFLNIYFSYATANGIFGSKFYMRYVNFMSSGNTFFAFFIKNFLVLAILIMAIIFLISLLLRETRIKKANQMFSDIAKINKEFNPNNPYLQANSNLANLQFLNSVMSQFNIKNVNSIILPEFEMKKQKLNPYQLTMVIACVVMGAITTIFTFVWGIM